MTLWKIVPGKYRKVHPELEDDKYWSDGAMHFSKPQTVEKIRRIQEETSGDITRIEIFECRLYGTEICILVEKNDILGDVQPPTPTTDFEL